MKLSPTYLQTNSFSLARKVDYLCWDGDKYDWLDEEQITSEPRVRVGFSVEVNNNKK